MVLVKAVYVRAAEQVQLTGKAPERSFQNTIRVPFRAEPRQFSLAVEAFPFA